MEGSYPGTSWTKENCETLSQNRSCCGRGSKRAPPDYKRTALSLDDRVRFLLLLFSITLMISQISLRWNVHSSTLGFLSPPTNTSITVNCLLYLIIIVIFNLTRHPVLNVHYILRCVSKVYACLLTKGVNCSTTQNVGAGIAQSV
jgi:hypothetical protein